VYLEKNGIRDNLKQHLLAKNIEAQIGTYALHMQPSYDGAEYDEVTNSTLAYQNLLTLPLHGELTFDDQKYVVESINDFLSQS
jgi:dTDP-4-amino-4,6-dideoxygalactose transaminase